MAGSQPPPDQGLADPQALLTLVPKEEDAAWHGEDDQAKRLDLDERTARRSISDE